MPKFCSNCGKPLQDRDAGICPGCGLPVWSLPPQPGKRNPWIAALLSFFFIGWGQWYNGRTWDGLKILGLISWAYLFALPYFYPVMTYLLAFVSVCFLTLVAFPESLFINSLFIYSLSISLVLIAPAIGIYGMFEVFRKKAEFTRKGWLFWLFVALLSISICDLLALILPQIPGSRDLFYIQPLIFFVPLGKGLYDLYPANRKKVGSIRISWLFWLFAFLVILILIIAPVFTHLDFQYILHSTYLILLLLLVFLPLPILWIYGMYDAFRTAGRINRREVEFNGKSRLFWLPVGCFVVSILIFTAATVAPSALGVPPPEPPKCYSGFPFPSVAATAREEGNSIQVTWQGGPDNSCIRSYNVTIYSPDGTYYQATDLPPVVGSTTRFPNLTAGQFHVEVIPSDTDGYQFTILTTYVDVGAVPPVSPPIKRMDFAIVNTYSLNGTSHANVWIKNTGSYRISVSDLNMSSVFVGSPENIGLVTLDNLTEGWSYTILGGQENGYWDPMETLEITATSGRIPTNRGNTLYFELVLPDGTKRSEEFTVS